MDMQRMAYVIGVLFVVFVTPACAGTQSSRSRTDPYADARAQAIAQINAYRAKVKLPPLQHWAEADSCADQEARRDSKKDQPHASFGTCGEMAQNECPDWPDPGAIATGCMEQMWNEGPGKDFSRHGHYMNMTNPQYTKVAIGFYTTRDGKVWSVQNFK
jgi:uncharacterized protein YkwD